MSEQPEATRSVLDTPQSMRPRSPSHSHCLRHPAHPRESTDASSTTPLDPPEPDAEPGGTSSEPGSSHAHGQDSTLQKDPTAGAGTNGISVNLGNFGSSQEREDDFEKQDDCQRTPTPPLTRSSGPSSLNSEAHSASHSHGAGSPTIIVATTSSAKHPHSPPAFYAALSTNIVHADAMMEGEMKPTAPKRQRRRKSSRTTQTANESSSQNKDDTEDATAISQPIPKNGSLTPAWLIVDESAKVNDPSAPSSSGSNSTPTSASGSALGSSVTGFTSMSSEQDAESSTKPRLAGASPNIREERSPQVYRQLSGPLPNSIPLVPIVSSTSLNLPPRLRSTSRSIPPSPAPSTSHSHHSSLSHSHNSRQSSFDAGTEVQSALFAAQAEAASFRGALEASRRREEASRGDVEKLKREIEGLKGRLKDALGEGRRKEGVVSSNSNC